METPQPKKRNFAISYLKGLAILFIMAIHLIDWGDIAVSPTGRLWKQVLFTGVVFFMATAGSVIWIAYGKSDDLKRSTQRLVRRGFELIGVYYLYNLVKFFVFDFSKEHFYDGFVRQDIFHFKDILTLKSFAVPIPILLTIGFFVVVSPIFLYILKKVKGGVWYLTGLLGLIMLINYIIPLPQNAVTNFFYARGNITFSLFPWFTAFLLGLLVAYAGFEKKKKVFLTIFLLCIPLTLWYARVKGLSWYLDESLHPLQPQAISISFAFMFLLIYFFDALQKYTSKKSIQALLSTLRVFGDFTLWLYVIHWIIIDLTIWIFSPRTYLIWATVSLMLIVFVFWKKSIIKKYMAEYEVMHSQNS